MNEMKKSGKYKKYEIDRIKQLKYKLSKRKIKKFKVIRP